MLTSDATDTVLPRQKDSARLDLWSQYVFSQAHVGTGPSGGFGFGRARTSLADNLFPGRQPSPTFGELFHMGCFSVSF